MAGRSPPKRLVGAIDRDELFRGVSALEFAHTREIVAGKEERPREILRSYEWLGDATVRVLEGSDKSSKLPEPKRGLFGGVWKITYRGRDYALKISVHDEKHTPFSIREGTIGAWLTAPREPPDQQRREAVPAYRSARIKDKTFDPFLHLVDYYGMLAMRADEGKIAFETFVADNVLEWRPILTFLHQIEVVSGTPKLAGYLLVHIVEWFDGGSLGDWFREKAFAAGAFAPGTEWDTALTWNLHYLRLAFYQVVLTIVRLRQKEFAHGDLHSGNVLFRLVDRADAMALYDRGDDTYNLLSTDVAPPFAGARPDEFPVFAISDLGFSALGFVGQTAGTILLAHQAQDIHKFAVSMFGLVVEFAIREIDDKTLGNLRDEDLWPEARRHARAFAEAHGLCVSLRKFFVTAEEGKRLWYEEGDYVKNLKHADNFVASLGEYARLWTDYYESEPVVYPGDNVQTLSAKVAILSWKKSTVLTGWRSLLLKGINRGNFGMQRFHPGSDLLLAERVFTRQKLAIERNEIVPSGMIAVDGSAIPTLEKDFGLERPDFVRGDEDFWRAHPPRGGAGGAGTFVF